MGNAAGSAEQPAGPVTPPPKQPVAPKQPMPAAGELEERFTRVLVSVAVARGAAAAGLASPPLGAGVPGEEPSPPRHSWGWGCSDCGFFQ